MDCPVFPALKHLPNGSLCKHTHAHMREDTYAACPHAHVNGTCTCTHTCTHTHACLHTHTHTYTHMHTHTHTHAHTCKHTYPRMHTHTYTDMFTHTYTHMHTHAHSQIHARTHTCIHTHAYTRKALSRAPAPSAPLHLDMRARPPPCRWMYTPLPSSASSCLRVWRRMPRWIRWKRRAVPHARACAPPFPGVHSLMRSMRCVSMQTQHGCVCCACAARVGMCWLPCTCAHMPALVGCVRKCVCKCVRARACVCVFNISCMQVLCCVIGICALCEGCRCARTRGTEVWVWVTGSGGSRC